MQNECSSRTIKLMISCDEKLKCFQECVDVHDKYIILFAEYVNISNNCVH